MILLLIGCKNYKTKEVNGKTIYTIEKTSYIETEEESDLIKIEVEGYGIIIAELYPSIAPITVKNFKKLVSEKFYDGLIFHRVIKNFMIQTGDPTGTGTSGSEETIKGEFALNGVTNDLSHTRGILSMARRGAESDELETPETMNSASSQFFIVHKDSLHLDGRYAAFGKVIHGMDVVDNVAVSITDENDKPQKEKKIKSIRFVNVYEGEE
ncbi:MAG: peptidylprolyl isomerase [Bacilli bacterium]|nr:peptidylprolyl isomerase [Bacilli bacterium]